MWCTECKNCKNLVTPNVYSGKCPKCGWVILINGAWA